MCVCVCVCAWGAGIQAGTTIPDHNGRKCERGSCSSQAFQDPFKEENQGYQLTSDFSLYKLLHMQVAQVTTKKTEIGYESSRLVGAGNEWKSGRKHVIVLKGRKVGQEAEEDLQMGSEWQQSSNKPECVVHQKRHQCTNLWSQRTSASGGVSQKISGVYRRPSYQPHEDTRWLQVKGLGKDILAKQPKGGHCITTRKKSVFRLNVYSS